MLLALACALTRSQLTAVVCALALALLGRGAYDVPLRALAATDRRAMDHARRSRRPRDVEVD